MFTIKYIYPDGTEAITGNWDSVSAEVQEHEERKYLVVHAHNEREGGRMTFGPNISPNTEVGYVYVMNDSGATVAKYML